MISKTTIRNTGNESIDEFYEHIIELYHTQQEDMAFSYLFKANREQLFNFFLLLTDLEDLDALRFFLDKLKIQKWVG